MYISHSVLEGQQHNNPLNPSGRVMVRVMISNVNISITCRRVAKAVLSDVVAVSLSLANFLY